MREKVRLLSGGLELIWAEGATRKLTLQEFVEGLAMNDVIVRTGHRFEE